MRPGLHSERHWETGKASGVPKPGDLSVRATMKPSGEGWWRARHPLRLSLSPILRVRKMGMIISGQNRRSTIGSLTTILLMVMAAACRSVAPPEGRLMVVDDAGDTVSLATPARRVVSLIPATTELLFAIGAGSTVVGRTSYCDFPTAAKSVPNLGDGIKPNLEAVIASRPDLVILYNSGQNAAVAGRLRELGVAALRLNTDALSSVPRIARLLGRLTDTKKAADSLSVVFDTALASATEPV